MPRHPGLALVTHRYDAESTAHLESLAAGAGVPARLAPVGHGAYDDVGAAVAALRDQRCDAVTLVPLMVTSDSRTVRELAALAPTLAHDHHIALAVASALDDAPEVVEVLSDRAGALADEAESQAVVLVGHGPSLDTDLASWTRLGLTLAEGVREVIGQCAADTGREVIVVPWLVGAGTLSRAKLRRDMADLNVAFDGRPLLPHPALDTWLARHLAVASMALTRAKPGSVVRLDER